VVFSINLDPPLRTVWENILVHDIFRYWCIMKHQLTADMDFLLQGKHDNHQKLQNALGELESLNEQLEEEQAARQDLQNKLSRANADAQQWKNKYDMEGASRVEELEDAKRRLLTWRRNRRNSTNKSTSGKTNATKSKRIWINRSVTRVPTRQNCSKHAPPTKTWLINMTHSRKRTELLQVRLDLLNFKTTGY